MSQSRFRWAPLVLAAFLSLGAAIVDTDQDRYTAGEGGVATFQNSLDAPLYLPGCAPFVFERSLHYGWVDIGPPFVCIWEGIAVAVGTNEIVETPFRAPDDTGIYRLRYTFGTDCEPDLPLSQANCQKFRDVYSDPFEVEREVCDSSEFGCQFRPAAPSFLCAAGQHISGPSLQCTRDPRGGECGYEFLECPDTTVVGSGSIGTVDISVQLRQPTEDDEIPIRIAGTWPDSCVPMNPFTSLDGPAIRIDTFNFDPNCLTVLTPWSETVSIGPLSVGDYHLRVTNSTFEGLYIPLGGVGFTVPEPSTSLLRVTAACSIALLARLHRRRRSRLPAIG